MDQLYLDKEKIQYLIAVREKIVDHAKQAFEQTGIDILANDTLNALSMYQIVSHYDENYDINFHRNGEDAKSGSTIIEQKCATVKPAKRKNSVGKSGWQFHAQGGLLYPRYIFGVRRKDNLKIVRLYDIVSPAAIGTVQDCLLEQKQGWINRGKPNHDAIVVPEKLLLTLPPIETMEINGCLVVKI